MSRVGKMPLPLTDGAKATITADMITVTGPLGSLSHPMTDLVKVASDNGVLSFTVANESRESNAMSGTMRALVGNMVHGVTKVLRKG